MVEFGEQLRRAREEKGMTQQSLAEQLYVTRQAVSRWECGDRYPDLLTTKKISQILEVSLDDLLSGKEMEKVVERNPVIEKKSVNNIMIALYAFVVISFFITIVDIIIRFPLQSEMISFYYSELNGKKKEVLRNDVKLYTVSPFDLIWDGDYYYLTGYCDEREFVRTYRVD